MNEDAAAEFNMKILRRFSPALSGFLLMLAAGCSPQPDLGGTWRAQMNGENSLTLNPDGTAVVSIDMDAGLTGHVRGTFRGIWKQVERDRLLLEMETAGVRTSEISRFVLQKGDLILTSEKNGQSMHYRRVFGPSDSSAEPLAGASSTDNRRITLTAEVLEPQIRALKTWRGDLLELTQAKVSRISERDGVAAFRAELQLRAKASTYKLVESVTVAGRQFALVETILVQGQDLHGSYEGTASSSTQALTVTAPPAETLFGLHRLDSLGKPGSSFTNALLLGSPEGKRVREASRVLAEAEKFLGESRVAQWAYATALSALDGRIGVLDAESAFVHLFPTVADELRDIRSASYRPDEDRLRAFRKKFDAPTRKGAENFAKQLETAKTTIAQETEFIATLNPRLP